jgi:predicted O-linked N-acetylglucosamine transferase (SPINDLY family)
VQVAYLGYAATTGLDAIDYRITDEWADPEGTTEHLHSEQLVRLPASFLGYHAPPYAPPLPERPRREPGRVTFGSFNKAAKLPAAVTDLWAELLLELPESRLVLKSVSFGDDSATNEFRARFAEAGVVTKRVELRPPTPSPADHLAAYADIDIALDPFPYHGATSTCEALWMGSPVVSLAGASHAGRVGVSLLHAVGLDNLVAGTPEEYVRIARALAEDPARLAGLHGTLRERVAASPLGDAKRLARELEDAYGEMWRRRCARASDVAAPAITRRSA